MILVSKFVTRKAIGMRTAPRSLWCPIWLIKHVAGIPGVVGHVLAYLSVLYLYFR